MQGLQEGDCRGGGGGGEEDEVCMMSWSLAEASSSCNVASLCSPEKLNEDMQYPSGKKILTTVHVNCFHFSYWKLSSFVSLVSLIATFLTFLMIIDARAVLQDC
jgi:hypothetical protein